MAIAVAKDWPTIHIRGLPEGERRIAQTLQELLHLIGFYVHDFAAAVALFDDSFARSGRSFLMGEASWAMSGRMLPHVMAP